VRDLVRRATVAAVRRDPLPGLAGWLGRALAVSRSLRERAFYDSVIDELLPHAPRARRALDVGCGTGGLMVPLRWAGWEVEGVEWDPRAVEVARQVSGAHVRQGDFRQVDLPPGSYDLVVLQHVFEHLDDPPGALRRIGDLLAPGGRAVLLYPNPGSLGARLFGACWFHWDPPRHLVIPTGRALAAAARRLGLTPIRRHTIAHSVADTISMRVAASTVSCVLAASKAYAEGRTVDTRPPQTTVWIRLAEMLERALVRVGVPVGEEVVVVLEKRAER
jgi:SAM-dependent methyltransferase